MNNAKKGLVVVGIVLILTLGGFIIKNYVFGGLHGVVVGSPLDILLLLPAIPFLLVIWLVSESIMVPVAIVMFLLAIIFLLLVGYGIGYWMDKRKSKQ